MFRIRCASMGSTIPRITDGRQHTKASRARARERTLKAHSRRPDARHHNASGHQLKKLVKPEVRRTAAAYLIAMEKWRKAQGITLEFTSPGKPTENGQIESFNETMHNEILRGADFENVREVRDELEKWREKYNKERPRTRR